MKKKLCGILFCLMLVVSVMGFVGCGPVENFNLSFVVDGNVYQTVSTNGNESISIPQNPVKEGFNFDGWFWDNETFEKPFTINSLLDTPINSDMRVYAKFIEKEPPHTHNYIETITSPTCVEKGYTTRICSCGDIVVDSYVNELGHSYSNTWTYDETNHWHSATCEHTGEIKDKAHHIFTNYVYQNDATYEKDGTEIATCICGKTDTRTKENSKLIHNIILFKTLSVDNENNVYGIVPNGTSTFSFSNEIIKSGTATYGVYLDIICSQEVKSKTVNLVIGDNTFYIYAENTDEEEVLYTVTIRVKPLYQVSFNTNGGTSVAMQTIEEDAFAVIPTTEPTKTGYIFKGWDFDFNTPITSNVTINAIFNPLYQVSFEGISEAQTIEINNKATTPTTEPTKTGYIFKGWDFDFETPITNDIMVNAIWQIDNDFAIFNFTSTISTCEITGIKDKTVTEIIVPNNVTSINQGAFSGCSKLESITLPFVGDKIHNSTDTYQYPFGYIFGTNSYTGGVATIQYYYGSSTSSTTSTTYYIPNTLKSVTITGGNILYRAFYNCSSLTSVTIGDSVESIGEDAFQYCSSLTSVEIPNSVTNIGNYAFYGCSNLTSIVMPDSVTSIVDSAFYGCGGLESIIVESGNLNYHSKDNCLIKTKSETLILGCKNSIIPTDGSVTSIGNYAFYNCSNLTSIIIPNSVTNIGNYAFYGCGGLESIIVESGNLNYHSKDNCLIKTKSKTLILGCKNSIIPTDGSVTSIGNYAFSNCSSLTSIIIPNSVTSIGDRTFSNCSNLTSVTIGDSVTSIGNYAFYNCISLTSVVIGDTVTSIGEDAFYGCNKLIQVINKSNLNITSGSSNYGDVGYYAKQIITDKSQSRVIEKDDYIFYNDNGTYYLMGYKGTDTELVLPNDINGNNYSIYKYAFYNCSSLTSIEIPNSVTSIGSYAFRYCSSLTSITYQGTTEEWNAIAKGSFWNDGTRNYIIHCTNGDINK